MKFIVQVVVIALLGWLLTLFLPWWAIAVAGFAGGYALKSKADFAAGFVAIALLWLLHALLVNMNAAVPLAEKVAALLMLNSKTGLFAVTSLIGGIVGGFSAHTGSLLRTVRTERK